MKCFKYTNRPKSYITVTQIEDPYEDGSGSVISVGCTLKGDTQNPTWKVHIPTDLAEGVAQEITRLCVLRRQKSAERARFKPSLFVDEEGNVVKREAPPAPVETLDVAAASHNAQVSGRVIKRQK
ncbi:MAG: hypothetical protein EBZ49_07550 [Proteobacteria bacterium]|nr:hypothetical protein [Pseudomonadota bacterium]